MEVYILDSLLRRVEVIDRFESLIWTERFKAFGDFELQVRSTPENRRRLQNGVKLAMNESHRVMTVETVEDGTDDEGRATLKLSGNSLESILLDRIAKPTLAGQGTWDINTPPAAVVRKLFTDICVTGILDPKDQIPFVVEGLHPAMTASNIPEPVDPIDAKIPPKPLYEAIVDICDVWTLGFRLLRNYDMSQIFWDVYTGSNRTAGQTSRPPVIFSPDLDNLKNTKELSSIESSKNVAYVVALNGALTVYPEDVLPDSDGFDRRVLYVDANDITLPYGTLVDGVPDAARIAFEAACRLRGKEELSKYRAFQAFDGEINQSSNYKYQRDYYLGDLVTMRNTDGVANDMRVTEQIFASDREGDRSYPTLEVNQFINTGSWLSQGVKTWADYESDPAEWSDMP